MTREYEERKYLLAELIKVYKELLKKDQECRILSELLKASEEEYANLFH